MCSGSGFSGSGFSPLTFDLSWHTKRVDAQNWLENADSLSGACHSLS